MIDQAVGLLRLQALLSWRTWTRGRTLAAAAAVALGILGTVVTAAAGTGLFLLAAHGLSGEAPYLHLLLFDALIALYFFVWVWSFLVEIQRHDVFDMRKLLHFPVSPGLVFSMNFAGSLLAPTALAAFACALAFVAGLTAAYGPHLAFAALHVVAFFFMLGAWQYHLRGWLSILMENKRRRQALMTVVALSCVLLAQLPALVSYGSGQPVREWLEPIIRNPELEPAVLELNRLLPPAWLALGAYALVAGDAATAAWTFGGMTGLGLIGFAWGYRSTLRFYLGLTAGDKRKTSRAGRIRRPMTARLLPPFAEDTASLAYAQFLGYSRHPQVRLQLFMPPILGLVLIVMSRSGDNEVLGEIGTLGIVPTAVLFMPFLNFSMMLFNLFGIDPRGFRGLMLLPVPRVRTLLAKNLALAPFVCGVGYGMLAVSLALLDLRWSTAGLLLLLIPQLYLAYCIVGNAISVFYPYRIARDTMRAKGDQLVLFFLGIASLLLAFMLCVPPGLVLALDLAGAPAGWPEGAPSPAFAAAVLLLGGTAAAYAYALVHTGDWLTVREQGILGKLMKDNS